MADDRQFDTILFDLEGTLIDFQWRLAAANDEILKTLIRFGIDPDIYGKTPDYACFYNTTRDITAVWEKKDAVQLFDQLSLLYDKYDQDALSRWAPYPDTQHLLTRLSAAGYRMGIVSNIGAWAANKVLESFNLAMYFEIILSRNDVTYIKPHSEGIELALEKLCTSARRTLFVGDSRNDIIAADRAEMPSCFLSKGESKTTGQNADSATFQVSSLSGIIDILSAQTF